MTALNKCQDLTFGERNKSKQHTHTHTTKRNLSDFYWLQHPIHTKFSVDNFNICLSKLSSESCLLGSSGRSNISRKTSGLFGRPTGRLAGMGLLIGRLSSRIDERRGGTRGESNPEAPSDSLSARLILSYLGGSSFSIVSVFLSPSINSKKTSS